VKQKSFLWKMLKKREAYQHDVWDRNDDETAGEERTQVGAHPPRSVHLRTINHSSDQALSGPNTAQNRLRRDQSRLRSGVAGTNHGVYQAFPQPITAQIRLCRDQSRLRSGIARTNPAQIRHFHDHPRLRSTFSGTNRGSNRSERKIKKSYIFVTPGTGFYFMPK